MTQITLSRVQVQKLFDFCEKHGRKQFFLAKDQGAYVGACGGSHEDGTFENCLFYFAGCDPKKNEDWYEEAHRKFGGDDFGERFEVSDLKRFLANPLSTKITIKVGASSITVKSFARPAPKPDATPKFKASPKPKAKAKVGKRGVGTVALEAIQAGKSNAEVLEAVKAEFPEANTSNSSVNWYRNKLRKSA